MLPLSILKKKKKGKELHTIWALDIWDLQPNCLQAKINDLHSAVFDQVFFGMFNTSELANEHNQKDIIQCLLDSPLQKSKQWKGSFWSYCCETKRRQEAEKNGQGEEKGKKEVGNPNKITII